MRKYLYLGILFIFAVVLIFHSAFPMRWHSYALDKNFIANPFLSGETDNEDILMKWRF